MKCPLYSAEKRLLDSMNLIIDVNNHYFKPELFRVKLNSCIQELRNVTFVLQKQKKKIEDFEKWYEEWKEKMRSDKVMVWLKESRNIIVKEGDLVTKSIARASLLESWTIEPSVEIEVPPLIKTEEIAGYLTTKIPNKDILDIGLLRIERKWIDSKLPETELIEALIHCFEVLMKLILDAHSYILSEEDGGKCTWFSHFSKTEKLLPPCAIATDWDRSIWFDLKSGERCYPSSFRIDPINDEKLLKKYPEFPQIFNEIEKPKNLKEEVELYFKQAKYILSKDGYHSPIVILGFPDNRKQLRSLILEDRAAKHLIYRQLAADIEKTGSNSVVFINETWIAPQDKESKIIHAADSPDRSETLMIIAAASNGEFYAKEILFKKDKNGKVIFGEERLLEGITPNFLTPILKVWTKNKN